MKCDKENWCFCLEQKTAPELKRLLLQAKVLRTYSKSEFLGNANISHNNIAQYKRKEADRSQIKRKLTKHSQFIFDG